MEEGVAPPPQEPENMGLGKAIPPEVPELVREYPTLEEYLAKWDRLKDHHARSVPGRFSRNNLVPKSVPELWQDCPYVPFSRLVSAESQARFSICRPHSSLEEASSSSGVPRYSHITGSMDYRRRVPLRLASLMTENRLSSWPMHDTLVLPLFVLNERGGQFLRLTPGETDALHECLQ